MLYRLVAVLTTHPSFDKNAFAFPFKIIFFFAAFIVVCLFGIIIGQTIKHNTLLSELDRTVAETERIEQEGPTLDEKLAFLIKDSTALNELLSALNGNANDETIEGIIERLITEGKIDKEIIDEILLREGYIEKDSDTQIYE